jgi:psiF repeat.
MINISHQRCKKVPLKLMLVITLLFPTSAMLGAASAAAWNGSQASQQDKVKACNNLADKKGLKGDDRKNFVQDCLNQAADIQKPSDMSTKDKMNSCKNLADKRNLKGEDRRSFLKDCMNKLNSK